MSIAAIVAVGVAGALALFWLTRDDRVGTPQTPHSSSSSSASGSIEAALRAGRKIEAIKLYREEHRVGLREAKEAVEAIERSGRD